MSTVSTDHARRAQRAPIVAEAVISACIHEIARPGGAHVERGIESVTTLSRREDATGTDRMRFAPPRSWDVQDLAA